MARFRPVLLLAILLALVACDGGGDPVGNGTDGGGFHPSSDASLSGTRRFTRIEIPPGVTVTATGDLVLDVEGEVVVNGRLVGDCVAITVRGGGPVTLRGEIANPCRSGPPPDPPDLLVVGTGGLQVTGARLTSSGDIEIKNDPSLSVTAFAGLPAGAPEGARPLVPAQAADCSVRDLVVRGEPARAAAGTAGGETGGAGADGATLTLACRGRLELAGTSLVAQAGGNGGAAANEAPTPARATAGAGGVGGDVRIFATGDIALVGFNQLRAGHGGDAGSAEAIGIGGASGDQAASATATGGAAGDGGTTALTARGAIRVDLPLDLVAGSGGDGGSASARAADGLAAGEAAAAQPAGDATARGGAGGDAGASDLAADGGVTGGDNVFHAMAEGGNGGDAAAAGGRGGDGGVAFPDGAPGGRMEALGGDGGDTDGPTGGDPGDGGLAGFQGGRGGDGAAACPIPGLDLPVAAAAGAGGQGGDASGRDGAGGQGPGDDSGEPGGVAVIDVGNGGDGGDGAPPGPGGLPGTDGIEALGVRSDLGFNFLPGVPGGSCPPAIAFSQSTRVSLAPGGDPARQDPQIFDIGAGATNPNQQPTGSVPIQLFVIIVGEQISVEGPEPWVDVAGTLEPDNTFVATGTGTIRGIADSQAEFRGLFVNGRVSGTYVLTPAGSPPVVYQINPVF